QVLFNESIQQSSGENTSNYTVDNGIGQPSTVQQDGGNTRLFTLTFTTPFTVGDTYNITVSSVQDLAGNPMLSQDTSFFYMVGQSPNQGDIVINEFMADESPSQGLPLTEYVELYNRSSKYF